MHRRCLGEFMFCNKTKKTMDESMCMDTSVCDDEPLTPGITITDLCQRKWRIGKPTGRGSFGRIYLASDDIDNEVTQVNARYVVKIEPHTSGPLFVEIHCLIRSGKTDKVRAWYQQCRLYHLGMPHYIASGSFTDETTGIKYRFLVLPRYDVDLQKVISKTKTLDTNNTSIIAIQVLDVLEYIHDQGYTHSDIKSSNLMIGFDGKKFKIPPFKHTSYEKNTKQPVVLSRRPKGAKRDKSRHSNYYDDDDFIVRHTSNNDTDKKLANVKQKISKILTEQDRSVFRQPAFNLRQLKNNINYADSSICSDWSYQKIDEFNQLPDELTHFKDLNEVYKEAVLSQSNGQVYLLDFGLASKFLDSQGNHKDFAMDARKAHDGTLEYSSRDSHVGAHSRRSDLENLAYNLLDWLTGSLPWKHTEILSKPDVVHAVKKTFMSDIKFLLKTCFKAKSYPTCMEKFLHYITKLSFTEKPDYDYCRSLFRSELLKSGYIFGKELRVNFDDSPTSPINRNCYSKRLAKKNTPHDFLVKGGIKKSLQRENINSIENGLKLELLKLALNTSSDGHRKPCSSRNFFVSDADLNVRLKKYLRPHDLFGKKLSPKNLRSKKRTDCKSIRRHSNNKGKFGNFMGSDKQFSWAEVLAGNPEDIIRKDRFTQVEPFDDDSTCKYRIRKLSFSSEISDSQSPLLQKDYLDGLNPTYAMKEVITNLKKKTPVKPCKDTEENLVNGTRYTPAMLKVYKLKRNHECRARSANGQEIRVSKRCTRSMSNKKNEDNKTIPSNEMKNSDKSSKVVKKKEIKNKNNDVTNAKESIRILPPRNCKKSHHQEVDIKIKRQKAGNNVTIQKRKSTRKVSSIYPKKEVLNKSKKHSPVKKTDVTKLSNTTDHKRKSLRIVLKRLDIQDISKGIKTCSNENMTTTINGRNLRSRKLKN
ncbi:unnamed protein product [Leptosia nina]|uniref:non-specific serine/threonine protein kinase n=1 Tax=Leptosia nina TaxID=320188 RepID=A0AAV1JM94_9NEOP